MIATATRVGVEAVLPSQQELLCAVSGRPVDVGGNASAAAVVLCMRELAELYASRMYAVECTDGALDPAAAAAFDKATSAVRSRLEMVVSPSIEGLTERLCADLALTLDEIAALSARAHRAMRRYSPSDPVTTELWQRLASAMDRYSAYVAVAKGVPPWLAHAQQRIADADR